MPLSYSSTVVLQTRLPAMRRLLLWMVLLLTCSRPLHASSWNELPLLFGQGGNRQQITLQTRQLDVERVEIFSPLYGVDQNPTAGHWQVNPTVPSGITVQPKAKQGGFHWIQARQERGSSVIVASTVHYFSEPAPSPRTMLQQPKAELEIIPMPLPREFARYRAGEEWSFLLRFRQQPLTNAIVHFHSEQEIQKRLSSDGNGMVRIRFPEKFSLPESHNGAPSAKPTSGRHDRLPLIRFALLAEHVADGREYQTTFSQSYAPDPYFDKSLASGAGFALLGMLCATPLLRRPKPVPARP
ncbi:MAG: hypothetical protein HQM06_15720 [Magnetococcales bacterium]|nr:hypothetical protein [Magnetococcales bacterium]